MKRNTFQGYMSISIILAILIFGYVYNWRVQQSKFSTAKINRQIKDKRTRIASLRIEVKRLRADKKVVLKRRKEVDEKYEKSLKEYELFKSGTPITEIKQQLEKSESETPRKSEIHDNVVVYFNQAKAKEKRGQVQEAIVDYDKIIELQPDNVKAYLYRGQARVRAAEYHEAIMDFDKIIELEPDNSTGYYHRAGAKSQLAKYVDAVIDYDTAIRLDPDDAMAYFGRSRANMELGLRSEGERDMNKAEKLMKKWIDNLRNIK